MYISFSFLLLFCFIVQFQQSVSSELKCLGRSSYTLCVNSPLIIRQALHPEASKKVMVPTVSHKTAVTLFLYLRVFCNIWNGRKCCCCCCCCCCCYDENVLSRVCVCVCVCVILGIPVTTLNKPSSVYGSSYIIVCHKPVKIPDHVKLVNF